MTECWRRILDFPRFLIRTLRWKITFCNPWHNAISGPVVKYFNVYILLWIYRLSSSIGNLGMPWLFLQHTQISLLSVWVVFWFCRSFLIWKSLCDRRKLFDSTPLWHLCGLRHCEESRKTRLALCVHNVTLKSRRQRIKCFLHSRIYTAQSERMQ